MGDPHDSLVFDTRDLQYNLVSGTMDLQYNLVFDTMDLQYNLVFHVSFYVSLFQVTAVTPAELSSEEHCRGWRRRRLCAGPGWGSARCPKCRRPALHAGSPNVLLWV